MKFLKIVGFLICSCIFLFSCIHNKKSSKIIDILKSQDFQKTINGKPVDLYFLKNETMQVAITNYGGRIVSILTPDKNGKLGDIVIGFKSIDDYLNAKAPFHGALVGRVANRIANGTFSINGIEYKLPINNGANHLHGGPKGFHNQVWDVKKANNAELVLHYLSVDGEMDYPGNLSVEVTYALNAKNELSISYNAETDQSTPFNPTNHAFFNLAASGSENIYNHELLINANLFTSLDSVNLPAKKMSVKNTPFDFTSFKKIGKDIDSNSTNKQLKRGNGYDHNFILNKNKTNEILLAATVIEPKSGRKMEVLTTAPCVQFFTGNFFNGSDIDKYGRPINYRASFALETQQYPNAPNLKDVPSIIINPGKTYNSKTIYRFSVLE